MSGKPPKMDRDLAALAAMAAPEETEIGNVTMRPLTAMSAALCALCGNRAYAACVGNEIPLVELTDYDLLEFCWIHCADISTVRRAVVHSGGVKEQVLAWAENVDFGVLLGARKALEFVKEQLAALDVEIAPKPPITGGKPETPPPNS